MGAVVREEPALSLETYATLPIAFRVESVLRADGDAVGRRFPFVEEPVAEPWVKDYDAAEGNRVTDWAGRWDLSRWGILAARDAGALVGAAAVAWSTTGVDMLEGRDDLTVLWDLRVAADRRRGGVGRALFAAAADWSRARGATEMKIETQDVNVPACRFYAAQGCVVSAIDAHAYPELPGETQVLWRLAL